MAKQDAIPGAMQVSAACLCPNGHTWPSPVAIEYIPKLRGASRRHVGWRTRSTLALPRCLTCGAGAQTIQYSNA